MHLTHPHIPTPKRILSLDGGGTRGVVTLAFLARIEVALCTPARPTLSHHFDLIGGTSTGAIIAAALALGWRVAEIDALYDAFAAHVFRRNPFRIAPLLNRYSAAPLEALLHRHFGQDSQGQPLLLGSAELRTGLAIVTKRVDTGSPWVVSNLPGTPYFADRVPPGGTELAPNGNHRIPLKDLVRASVAAPTFFRSVVLPLGPDEHGAPESGLFVDGGASPYNNPALLLFQLARLDAYGLRWPATADDLLIVSVGTGRFRLRQRHPALQDGQVVRGPARLQRWLAQLPDRLLLLQSMRTLLGMVGDGQQLALTMLRGLGTSPQTGANATGVVREINSELGDLAGECLAAAPLFTALRYDIDLEHPAGITASELASLRRLDAPANMARLKALAQVAAAEQVVPAHLHQPRREAAAAIYSPSASATQAPS